MKLQSKRQLSELLKTYQRIEKIWDTTAYRNAVKRVARMSTHDMISWADEAGTAMCKIVYDFSGEKDPDTRIFFLQELTKAISGLQAITEELMRKEKLLQ